MNTKILVSLLVIGLTAIAIGGSMTGAFFSDTETSNQNTFAAGDIDLKVDSECHYNGNVCVDGFWQGNSDYPAAGTPCDCTWELKDIEPTVDKFFNFGDIKPGDYGENTLSFHVTSNDAWMCATINNVQNNENECIGPEVDAGDETCGTGIDQGELAQEMNFIVWADTDCDNILEASTQVTPAYCSGVASCDGLGEAPCNAVCVWNPGQQATQPACTGPGNCVNLSQQACDEPGDECIWNEGQAAIEPSCTGDSSCIGMAQNVCEASCTWNEEVPAGPGEQILTQGNGEPFLNGMTYPIADSTTGTPIKGSSNPDDNTCIGIYWCAGTISLNPLTCDGSSMGNTAQTDSLIADISFTAEQARNNPNFRCITPS